MEKNSLKGLYKLIMIGGSAGSFEVLAHLIPLLHPHFQIPIIIVVHRKSDIENLMVQLFSAKTKLKVKEAEDKERIKAGTLYIAPADYHLLIEKNYTFSLDASEKVNFSRPSIDVCFQSAAEVFGSSLACILLSGANADGVEGLVAVKQFGGLTVVQNPASAEIAFMPRQAINRGGIDVIIEGKKLGEFINSLQNSIR